MLFLLGYVVLAAKESRWCWPVSIVGVVLYTIQAVHVQLYGEIPLQFYYIGISVYGWFAWKKGSGKHSSVKVSWLSFQQIMWLTALGIAGTLIYGYFLDHVGQVLQFAGLAGADQYIQPSAYPYPDAFTTAFSFIGTYLQARKKIENWILWLIVDAVYVGMWGLRESYFFSALNVLYLVLATYGFIQWYKSWKRG